MKKLIETIRSKRIERILNTPQTVLLGLPWTKRILSIVVVTGSWAYVFAITPLMPQTYVSLEKIQGVIAVITFVAFLLLKLTVRRITSVPEQYLDERQLADRDWAFKMGYLVVRRVGLGVTTGLVVFSLYVFFAANDYSDFGTGFYSRRVQIIASWEKFIRAYFENEPVYGVLKLVALLTFVAYSFPVILLAWRDARYLPIEAPVNHREQVSEYTKLYFKKLGKLALFPVVFMVLVGIGNLGITGWVANFLLMLLFTGVGYGIYLYFWALFKQYDVISWIKAGVADKHTASKRHLLIAMFVATSLVGMAVPTLMFLGASQTYWIPDLVNGAVYTGLGLVFLQASAFVLMRGVGRKTD